MIILIAGASHTGKTALAQELLERLRWPYLSLDLLKMGLIRAGRTDLTPSSDDDALTALLWPIARGMVRTALENRQHLIVEGCYIPFGWARDFDSGQQARIRGIRLAMSERYIRTHFDDIARCANVIEQRLDDSYCTLDSVLADNARTLRLARQHHEPVSLIDGDYRATIDGLIRAVTDWTIDRT